MLNEESNFNFKGRFFIAYMKAEYLLRATSRYTKKKNQKKSGVPHQFHHGVHINHLVVITFEDLSSW